MLDFADFVAINKFDRKGRRGCAARRAQAVPAQPRTFTTPTDDMPVFGTRLPRFNDDGVTALYQALVPALAEKGLKLAGQAAAGHRQTVVQPARHRAGRSAFAILAEIADRRGYHAHTEEQVKIARERQSLRIAKNVLPAATRTADFDEMAAFRTASKTRRPRSCSTCGRRPSRPIPATSTS